jgi:hypothetical protein
MSLAAKAGEMQIFSSDVIEKHLKHKPLFNFACPSGTGISYPGDRVRKSQQGLKQNSATLIPKMMPKSPRVDDKLTEFMTRLVSPPSRQTNNNPMHSTLTGGPTGASGSYRT